MIELLEKKKVELAKSLQALERQYVEIQEQIAMHRGAIQYNDKLIEELKMEEKKDT